MNADSRLSLLASLYTYINSNVIFTNTLYAVVSKINSDADEPSILESVTLPTQLLDNEPIEKKNAMKRIVLINFPVLNKFDNCWVLIKLYAIAHTNKTWISKRDLLSPMVDSNS